MVVLLLLLPLLLLARLPCRTCCRPQATCWLAAPKISPAQLRPPPGTRRTEAMGGCIHLSWILEHWSWIQGK